VEMGQGGNRGRIERTAAATEMAPHKCGDDGNCTSQVQQRWKWNTNGAANGENSERWSKT